MSFVPLPTLHEAGSVDVHLPEYVREPASIGFDMERLGVLAFVGGFASRVTVTSSPKKMSHGLPHNRPPLVIPVDTNDIAQRISQARRDVRDPGLWASQLHHAITRGLRQASWRHFARNPQYSELNPFVKIEAGTFEVSPQLYSPARDGARFAKAGAFLDRLTPRRQKLHEACFSIFPVVHPDAVLLVAGLSRVLRVVRKIEPAIPDTPEATHRMIAWDP